MRHLLITTVVACVVAAASAGAGQHRVAVDGTELAYVEAGQGAPVVFVHGGLQDYRLWLAHLDLFGRQYRAIAYSRRNHFPNAVGADGAADTMGDIHGDDLARLIERLSLGRVHVVAHSGGALAALFLAANHPGLVRTLVVNEPPATGLLATAAGGPQALAEFRARADLARKAFLAGDVQQGLRLFADAVGGPGTYDRRSSAERRMMMDNALERVAEARGSSQPTAFTCDMAKRITAPTLLMNGERSPTMFHRIVDELARCVPNAERIVVSDASHTVPSDNPKDFAEVVLAFLAKH